MCYIISIFFFLFYTTTVFGQELTCKDFRQGVFQFEGVNGGYHTVIRNDSVQFERNTKRAQHSTMKIKWDTECTYTLSELIEFKWGEAPVKEEQILELKNIVYKVEKPNKFYVKTYLGHDTAGNVFFKVDTTNAYGDIFELERFKEYKDATSYGQTLLGEIYAIDYYQSNKDAQKYLIVFETMFQTEHHNRFILLDSKVVPIGANEKITHSNCRFNGNFDEEILAIYKPKGADEDADIIRAFRCNRQTKKIEEVDAGKVGYREEEM